MKKYFSIGEVSKIKNITIKALRYYHKVGILIPRYIDASTGYRYYSIDQFIHIDIIKGCREMGTSIAELQEIFKQNNTNQLLEYLQLKKIEALNNICTLENIIQNIDMLSSTIKKSNEIIKNDNIKTEYFDERPIIILECEEINNLSELIYYSDLDKEILEKNIETSLDRGIIYAIISEDEIKPKFVFHGIKNINKIKDKSNIKILPKGKYLTLIYNSKNIKEKRKEILKYIKDKNLSIDTILEVELFDNLFNTEDFNCQIQVLISSN